MIGSLTEAAFVRAYGGKWITKDDRKIFVKDKTFGFHGGKPPSMPDSEAHGKTFGLSEEDFSAAYREASKASGARSTMDEFNAHYHAAVVKKVQEKTAATPEQQYEAVKWQAGREQRDQEKQNAASADEPLRLTEPDDAYEWIEENFTQEMKNLSREQRRAVIDYKYGETDKIQNALRSNAGLFGKGDIIEHLDAALQEVWVSQPVTVYRGLGVEKGIDLAGWVGKTVRDQGYISTSVLPNIAQDFCEKALQGGKVAVLFECVLPKGTYCLAPDILEECDEHELLLQRGSGFRVTKVEERPVPGQEDRDQTQWHVQAEYVEAAHGG